VRVGRGTPPPPPRGPAICSPQPALHHAGVLSAQNWLTGERLCGGDANALAEELEPMWLNALLLRVPEAFGYYAIPVCTRPEAEFGLGVRWSLALTS
jgi:hypothetical protein